MKAKDQIDRILSKLGVFSRGRKTAEAINCNEQDQSVQPRSASEDLIQKCQLGEHDEKQEGLECECDLKDSMNAGVQKARIYVASLADYNAGRLHGRWIDANQDAEDIQAEVSDMLKESLEPSAEEWAIHDYEGFWSLDLGEWESFDKVAEVAQLLTVHGELFAALMNHFGGMSGLDEAKSTFEDGYRGEWETLADYVASFVEDFYGERLRKLPAFIAGRIDYEGIGRDMELSGDVFTVELSRRCVHVFIASR